MKHGSIYSIALSQVYMSLEMNVDAFFGLQCEFVTWKVCWISPFVWWRTTLRDASCGLLPLDRTSVSTTAHQAVVDIVQTWASNYQRLALVSCSNVDDWCTGYWLILCISSTDKHISNIIVLLYYPLIMIIVCALLTVHILLYVCIQLLIVSLHKLYRCMTSLICWDNDNYCYCKVSWSIFLGVSLLGGKITACLPPVPVTYAWRDELERKTQNAIDKLLGQAPPSRQFHDRGRHMPTSDFDHVEDEQVHQTHILVFTSNMYTLPYILHNLSVSLPPLPQLLDLLCRILQTDSVPACQAWLNSASDTGRMCI